jgi:hypothetical protein
MRRLIAVFLMIVLPLQLSWAVAATYCQDEQDPGDQHFGHHVHSHQDGADTGKHPTKSTQKAENDCGCSGHLCSAHLLPVGFDVWSSSMAELQFFASETHLHPTSDPPQIERPNWIDSL